MPIEEEHVLSFLENASNEKYNSELIDLLIKRINKLCFEECQIDRIQCTLTPLCTRRFLLKLRIKNNLQLEDLPKFCYSVHKNVVLRDFRGKTVVYKPNDAYLYLIDFLDIFFHGDYRKLNKFITFDNWDEAYEIFERRINKDKENFQYYHYGNYFIVKYDDRIHATYIEQKYVICNCNRENITDLNLLYGLCQLFKKIHFPEFRVSIIPEKHVILTAYVTQDVLNNIEESANNDADSNLREYFWSIFPEDIESLTKFTKKVHMELNRNRNLEIKLYLNLETNNYIETEKNIPLRFRDMRLIFNFMYRLYHEFYILWVK
ncbi:MAG: hypothetical protein GF383_13925 [Candidatus Lokiarchaeota archaeon]|nr:hypothetical protein [Candidatus Lokiarchaeota archaeon]MBD3342404.1 hypothetical protein [Candidatus Lokiarchaeota archaeon]